MAGIMPNQRKNDLSLNHGHSSSSKAMTVSASGGQTSTFTRPYHNPSGSMATPGELDALIRQVQKNGRCHIRTLTTLAIVNLLCWVPLYVVALVAPVGKSQQST